VAQFNWQGGGLNGAASLTVANGGVLNISGDSPKSLYGALADEGTGAWYGTGVQTCALPTYYGYSGAIENKAGGLFDIQNDQPIRSEERRVGKESTSTWRTGAGKKTKTINERVDNRGTVDEQSGTLSIQKYRGQRGLQQPTRR